MRIKIILNISKKTFTLFICFLLLLSSIPLGVLNSVVLKLTERNIVDELWWAQKSNSVIDNFTPQSVEAAEMAVDTAILDATDEFGVSPSSVFTTDQIGYVFFIDGTTQDLVYRKTVNGGDNWTTLGTIDSAVTGWTKVAVWYDQWTPGDTLGTNIHIAASDDTSDDIFYASLDTSDDSATSVVTAVSGSTTLDEDDDGPPSITKSAEGNLFISGNFTSTAGGKVSKSSDGISWADISPGTWSSVQTDQIQLLPLSTGDDVIAIKADTTADKIYYRIYSESGDSWADSWTEIASLTDNATYDQWFSAAVEISSGDIYLSFASNTNNSANNIEFWIFDDSDRDSYFQKKTNLFSSDATVMMPVPMVDEDTGDIYVSYLRGTLNNTMNVYFKYSTDGGESWSDESVKLNASGDDFKSLRTNMTSGDRLVVVFYCDDRNDVFLSTVIEGIEITIDDTILDASDEFGPSPNTVFISEDVGYVFYIDGTSQDLAYRTTTDGGANWGNSVSGTVIDTSIGGWTAVSVWYDQWTPGDTTGTLIHIAAIDDSNDDVYYTYLDTDGNTLRGSLTQALLGTTVTEIQNVSPSITKSAEGNLFIAANFASYTGSAGGAVAKSSDGTTWTPYNTGWSSASLDQVQLLPLKTGDDVIAIKADTGGNKIYYQIYSESSDGWAGSWNEIGTLYDNGTYDQWFSATIKKSTGDVYLTYANYTTNSDNDIEFRVFDDSVRGDGFVSGGLVYENSQYVMMPVPLVDENNGDIYVAYLRGTLADNMQVYYKKSTNNGSSWGSESSSLSPAVDDDHKSLRGNILSSDRLYIVWYNDDLNDVMGTTLAYVWVPIVSITISDGTVSYGTMETDTIKTTLSGDMPPSGDLQTVTNEGNVAIDLTIKGYNASGGGCTWTLASSNDDDQYVHQFCNETDSDCSSPPTSFTALTLLDSDLKDSVVVSGTVDFHLRLITPLSTSCGGQQNVNVTVTASQS